MSDEKKSLSGRMQVMAELAESPNTWRPVFLHREDLLSEIRRLRAEHARHLRSLAFEVAALERERDSEEISTPRTYEENLKLVRETGHVRKHQDRARLSTRKLAAVERGVARIFTAYPHLLKVRQP
jgi:hypothetical protein